MEWMMELSDHVSLDGMTYGELHTLASQYFAKAMLSQVARMDDAALAARALAQQNGESMDAQRLAGRKAYILKARELGL
jgi:hypothetical protein